MVMGSFGSYEDYCKAWDERHTCKICGVVMAQNWSNGICIHCDWYLGEGYSEEQIKDIMRRCY
jgi:hypothetical protein